jgi:hypothetical protein
MRIHLDREGTKRIKVLGGSNGELVSERLRELVSERLRSRALLKSNTGRIAAALRQQAQDSTITDNIVRVGLNYQFY